MTRLTHRFIATPVDLFIAWLSLHTSIAYLILFLGAFFEALIGPSFFIPGELFFLSGSILAGRGVLNIWFVIACVYAGALLADSTSYWIGRALGPALRSSNRGPIRDAHYERAERMLERYGFITIFIARLVGPFSKIAPVVAGMLQIPFTTFLAYNIPGVIIGIGQFLVIGYFFGDRYATVLHLFERYLFLFFAALVVFVGLYIAYRRRRRATHAASVSDSGEQAGVDENGLSVG